MSLRGSKLGQGTLEYILLTTLVVGIVLTIFNGPLKRFLSSYTSRKTEYTNVVAQRNMGIPLRWFGGDFKNPDASAGGGATTGGATAGEDPEDPNAGGAPDAVNGPNDSEIPGSTDPEGASPESGNPPGRGGGANGPGSNNSLLSPGSSGSNTNNNGGRSRGRGSAGDRDNEDDSGTSGTITGGRGVGPDGRGDGELGSDPPPANETEEEKEARIKKNESGDTLRQERELFGSNTRRVREGSCGDLDLKVILQIAFVLGLLFMLASLLFQKRGDD